MLCLQVLVQLVKNAEIVRSDVMIGVRTPDSPLLCANLKLFFHFVYLSKIYICFILIFHTFFILKFIFFWLGLILILALGLTLCWAGPDKTILVYLTSAPQGCCKVVGLVIMMRRPLTLTLTR
jgi:hypothetical protein